ncbi:MAG: hypothetical protein KAJ73_00635 [Zetaproteobacteria bacterium]|nr:hypothetical protein [Zetaproteobacteria bacterium]
MKIHDKTNPVVVVCLAIIALLIFFAPDAKSEEIPPEVMAKLRAQIMADQAAVSEAIRVPDVSGFPEHIQRICLVCHEDKASMLKAADGVLTEEEMLKHTLFARNIEFIKPAGITVILVAPTWGVDFLKDPNELCVMWQRNYPSVTINAVLYRNVAGENIQHKCQLIRES